MGTLFADLKVNFRFRVKFQITERIRAGRYEYQYLFVKCRIISKEIICIAPALSENARNLKNRRISAFFSAFEFVTSVFSLFC